MPHDFPAWVRDAVFYQVFPDRFAMNAAVPKPKHLEAWDSAPTLFGFKGGDLLGLRDRLPYVKELGCNAVYLNPVFASTANHRYHTLDYYRVDPILGGNDALRTLLDEAHRLGLRIVLDGVFNHASRAFYQFNHTLENGPASPFVDWFHFNTHWFHEHRPLNPYPTGHVQVGHDEGLAAFGYRCWWGIPSLPKFNTKNPEVRAFLLDVGEHWMRFGIDGWRLDVPNEIDDDEFWREFRRRVKAINPEGYIVGEIWDDAHRWLQGDQFDGVMNYPLTRAILGFAAGRSLNREQIHRCGLKHVEPIHAEQFAGELTALFKTFSESVVVSQLNILGTHDTPRLLTMVGGDENAVRLAQTLLFTLPGAPSIYYGDEVGMAGEHDPDCRRAFDWDEHLWNKGLRAYVQGLARIRHEVADLRRGGFRVLLASGDVAVFERGETVIVAVNADDHDHEVEVALLHHSAEPRIYKDAISGQVALASAETRPGRTGGALDRGATPTLAVMVPARSGQIWVLQD